MMQTQCRAELRIYGKVNIIVHTGWAAGSHGAAFIRVRLHGQDADQEYGE
jgi:hypothetical protein